MDANMVLALGLGMRPPWRLVGQRLDTGKQLHELHLDVCAERGSLFACPACGKACKAHDFAEFTWRNPLETSKNRSLRGLSIMVWGSAFCRTRETVTRSTDTERC